MHYIFSYDVTDDGLRTHIAHLLTRKGCIRLQYSVWFSPEWSPKRLQALHTAFTQLLVKYADDCSTTDSLVCVPIERNYLNSILWIGDDTKIQTALSKNKLVWI